MAYGFDDRVREQGTHSGTGAVTLPNVAVSGFQTFLAGWGASGTGEYCIVIGSQWETGFGTLNAGGTSLTRTTVYDGSSGAGVAVNFSSGTADIFGAIPAELSHFLNMAEITVASAATADIGAVRGSNIVISGTTTITSFGTSKNRRRVVRFSGALTLTHNGTSLILSTGASRATVAGDVGIYQSDASGNWREVNYHPSGFGAATQAQMEAASSNVPYLTPANAKWHPGMAKFWVRFNSAGAIAASHNVASITDHGTGDWSVNIADDFSSGNYSVNAFGGFIAGITVLIYAPAVVSAGAVRIQTARRDTGVAADPDTPDAIFAHGWGDQ